MFKASYRLCTLSKQATNKEASKLVNVQYYKGFAKVTLNNPKVLNSLNLQMIKQLMAELPALNKTKAFWIEGAGGKAFCAGGDVKSLYEGRESNPEILADFFRDEFTLDYQMTNMNSLQISNWDGIVMGGGVGLSVFSPFRIATENTIFAMPQTKIGFFTDVCGGYFLSRLRNNIGYYLGLTGMRLKGEQIYKAGIANYFIPRQKLSNVFSDLKSELVHSREPKETVQEILLRYNKPPINRVIEHEDDIRYIFNSQSVQQIFQKLKQNKTPFYAKIREAIEQQCPISTHVTFRSIQQSKKKIAKDCFITDYSISQRFMQGNDFFEGVRCTLVDKGAKPKWTHDHVLSVKDAEVDKYFEPLTPQKLLKL